MIEITINVTNATNEEKAKLNELYKKTIEELSKETTIFYQDSNSGGLGVKSILSFQSIEDLSKNKSNSIKD